MTTSGNRRTVSNHSQLLSKRGQLRQLLLENLERRDLMANDASAPIFAPGTSQEYVNTWIERLARGNGQGGQNEINLPGSRWTDPVGGNSPNRGDPAIVTWSIVPDGTRTSASSNNAASDLIAFMDSIYGGANETVVARKPWFPIFDRAYARWGEVSGLTMVYEPNDDGAAMDTTANSRGVAGVRGDMRISGARIDGDFGILAFNFFPNTGGQTGLDGDMTIDTGDVYYRQQAGPANGENRALFNILMHEAGHGIGLGHVIPVNETKLMEPFISLAYLGAQHDDILAAQTLYGDDSENNDSAGSARDLGLLRPGLLNLTNRSIDNRSDLDFYNFRTSTAERISITVKPVGFTYEIGPQGGATSSTDSLRYKDLAFTLETAAGQVLATVNARGLAGTEELLDFQLPAAGGYRLRVSGAGATNDTQLYDLTLRVAQRTGTSSGPQLIGIQPNNDDLLNPGDVLTVAPRELVFRFDDDQVIQASSLQGIRITRSGGDGSFGLASVASDFGSNGKVDIQLTSKVLGETITLNVTRVALAANAQPQISVNGNIVNIVLNSNSTTPTTASQLVSAINGSSLLTGKLEARLNGGFASTPLGTINPATYSPIQIQNVNDIVVQPGRALVGDSPDENEVTFRFAENLPDDYYRIEIFGFDDANAGVTGLRGSRGELFVPTVPGTRKDTIDFRLDLGTKVSAIVPQPVVRQANDSLTQQRDTIVVYFDSSDKLLVENTPGGAPTSRSVENPALYQLIFTSDSVRNTDDQTFNPQSVTYNASTNTATLKFSADLNALPGSNAGPITYRLRIGNRETTPLPPTRSEATATVISDLGTGGAVKLRFSARAVGEAGNGITLNFINSLNGTPSITGSGNSLTIDMGRANLTAAELVDLIRTSSVSSVLITVDYERGSNENTVVGNRNLAYAPLTLRGLGSSFDTAMNIGAIGSNAVDQTSIILTSTIDAQPFALDLPGASDDPGHRTLTQNLTGQFEDHVNPLFGADSVAGISTIYYNFKSNFSRDVDGNELPNSMDDTQRQRAREALSLWAKYIGVQFVETQDLGLTIATGALRGLVPAAGTRIQLESALDFGVRIDRTFNRAMVVLSSENSWDFSYGQDYFRALLAGIGMTLGLTHAGDLPETTLMRLDPTFMAGSGPLIDANDSQLNASDEKYEPVFPGNQDVLHGRYLFRDDGTDIDLYRFEVDLGDDDAVGLFVAETYAQRLTNSSSLNTNLQLYKQFQASGSTNFGLGDQLLVNFRAMRPGTQGNDFQIFLTQTDRGVAGGPTLTVYPNGISIDLNATPGFETTVGEVLTLLANSSAASRVVKAELAVGFASTKIGGNTLTQNPVVLQGGRMELISQNDDYFSRDSVIRQRLSSGVYFLGVSASGNDEYNASIPGTGSGGKSQGDYELRISFRAQVDINDSLQDLSGSHTIDGVNFNHPSVGFDGDSDGLPGGVHNFWFQTRGVDRVLNFTSGGSPSMEDRVISVTGANGTVREFQFSKDSGVAPGRFRVAYQDSSSVGQLATALAAAINARSELGVTATVNGSRVTLRGEQSIRVDSGLTQIDVIGKTIFVDKTAGSTPDGSLARPFNNISRNGVANAFAAAQDGDIIRIVGNGGNDKNLATIGDNFAYEIGTGLIPGQILSDGTSMEVPKGVTVMVDAGAIFKMRQSQILVGSSSLDLDRSGSSLQVLGTPFLVDNRGNAVLSSNGSRVAGSVFFTSWLDESIGRDSYSPTTVPAPGQWGGISFRRDVDASAGRSDLEDEGIFLRYVNHADIRFGGGTVVVNTVQQTVTPIEMLDTRPTITYNRISRSANSAMSALPNSFEENNFNEPRYQLNGLFTSDYDRVGPDIYGNTLTNNSVNGLFIRVDTPVAGSTQTLTVPGRFDDIDIVHVLTENVVVTGTAGGTLLDSTVPPSDLISTAGTSGGILLPGTFNYKITYVDRNGYESVPSAASASVSLLGNETAISIAGLPAASGDFIARRLYRSNGSGSGSYELIATLDRTTSTFLDLGRTVGGALARDRADVSTTIPTQLAGGNLAAGTYTYRVVMTDAGGREGLASAATVSVTLAATGSVQVNQIPFTLAGYVGRRVYRSQDDGNGPYVLIAELPDSTSVGVSTIIDNGATLGQTLSPESLGVKRPRLNASLVIDPGTILKLEGSRLEATFGASIIAEGTDGLPIVFTSRLDDRYGAGGTFDTNNNGAATIATPRDWGGIYMSPTSNLSVDHARFSYAGGITKLEGTFRAFNTIEIQQAEARIANTLFENNADGFGGQGPGGRFGRLSNAQSTIFVRGAQPTIIGNVFKNNVGSAIEIDANSMNDDIIADVGRQTGAADRNPNFAVNRGPLIRGNRMINNDLNGLEIRAGVILTTASVWDDTDIVHVVSEGIFVQNMQHEGGLRLQSAPNESLVVKFDGYGSNFNPNIGAGLTANGQLNSGDRVGGTLHVLGQPGFPVILTSIHDDTVGAGLQPDGKPQTDTNNNGIGSRPQAADWRGLFLDQYSNDRNVVMTLEAESTTAAAPGPNGQTSTAQSLGSLAPRLTAGNENLRLGFTVEGVLSQSTDVDVYSFTAEAGTEIWIDVDQTRSNLDLVLDLLDTQGNLLAQSNNSTAETLDSNLLVRTSAISPFAVNPMPTRTTNIRLTASGLAKEDGTTNILDPGMRVRLPGNPGSRSTFYFRIRSVGLDVTNAASGLSSGTYQVQVRLREAQEFAGSIVSYADIRYAMNGVHLRGMPTSSPLMGEAAEDETTLNNVSFATYSPNNGSAVGGPILGNRPQYIGNILDTANGAISVAGNLSELRDVDFYRLDIDQNDVVGNYGGFVPVVLDIDYADGLDRPDTSINVFVEEPSANFGIQYRLIYSGDSSNIADDLARPFAGTDLSDLTRGSVGTRDGYIGPIALPPGRYVIGVSSGAFQPRAKILNPFTVRPISSIRRIVDEGFVPGVTTADPPVVSNFLPRTNIGPSGELVSSTFNLGGYAAGDEPTIYLDYTFPSGSFSIFVRNAAGVETQIGNSVGAGSNLQTGTNSFRGSLRQFAGQNGLSIVFRSTNANTRLNNVIIGFAERGEQIGAGDEAMLLNFAFLGQNAVRPTRTFSLVNYEAAEVPQVVFEYQITDGDLDVFAVDRFGNARRLATSADDIIDPPEVPLVVGQPARAVLDISFLAGQPGLTIEFRTRDDDPTNVIIRNVHIQLENGSRIFSDEPNSTYGIAAAPNTMIRTGAYQLEVRLAENFFRSSGLGAPVLTKSYDTNDRFAEQLTLVAPRGADLTPGDKFEISDGGNRRVFEFTLTGTVGLGNVPIRYVITDTASTIANKIRDAINNPSVRSGLSIVAASSGGISTGTSGLDVRVNLMGSAEFRTIQLGNPLGRVQVIQHTGSSDRNVDRHQGQVVIQNNFIRNSRDYGVWSEPAARLKDPSEQLGFQYSSFMRPISGGEISLQNIMQSLPGLSGTQAVRNLPVLNDGVEGGMISGLVIQNNLLEAGGLGGINLQGESPIWMITPGAIPTTDNDVSTAASGSHFGSGIDDGDLLVVDSDRTRIRFEFEDIAGGGAGGPDFGSGAVQGNGYSYLNSPMYYREDNGQFYNRISGPNLAPFGSTALETMMMMRDSILGSMFVTNGTTQTIKATVAKSLLGADPDASTEIVVGYPNYFNRPALFLEGVTNIQYLNTIGAGSPFFIQELALGAAPQPHARLVNNTIVGKDGRASFNGDVEAAESNDTIGTAVETWQGTAHNPLSYNVVGEIGDNTTLIGGVAQDVDIYQFKLGVGDRVLIDIDTPSSSNLDAVMQIFDSRGVAQGIVDALGEVFFLSDNTAAPGESTSRDPYIDFTATSPGVYYVAVSSAGNSSFDPLSFANRRNGTTTGAYNLSLSVRHPQDFTITVENASAYNQGDTFTIHQIPDFAGTTNSSRTFEFTFTGAVSPGNIPIQLAPNWFFPDVARAIAKAINEGDAGQPVLRNEQSLPNGSFQDGSPLKPVLARALGGLAGVLDANFNDIEGDVAAVIYQISNIDELGLDAVSRREIERQLGGPYRDVNQGLELFPRRSNEGVRFADSVSINGSRAITNYTSQSHLGLGHDRQITSAISLTSVGDGTTEKFVVINNAAFIEGRGNIIVDPDANGPTNLDQYLPETGILVTRGASPTILNNVFFNVQTPVVNEESRVFPLTGVIAPYGSNNPNVVSKPGAVVLGGSIFQYTEPGIAGSRLDHGIERGPTNVPNTSLDQNVTIADGARLFVNPQGGLFLPAPGSALIDNAIDSLPERTALRQVKEAVGIPISPLLTPETDIFGQLRTDDPAVSPPGGQGQSIFKDRGAFDRADFTGPAAILLDPIDNDALGIDQDQSVSFVELESGVYPEFRIQLSDGREPTNPFIGIGVDDSTVSNSIIPDQRLEGAAIALFEDGRLLQESIDYRFTYNATRDEIILTPLAGVWKNGRVYEVSLNNRDRFVIQAPSGDRISDGQFVGITDTSGVTQFFEFDSGYRIQIPQGLELRVPIAGGGAGGIFDGDRFTINDTTRSVTFEFDRNANLSDDNNFRIAITASSTQEDVTNAIVAAIQGSGLNLSTRVLSQGRIFIGARTGTTINTRLSSLTQPATVLSLEVPLVGARPDGISDGQVFSVSDGLQTEVFEFDTDGTVGGGNIRVDLSGANTANDVARAMLTALRQTSLNIQPSILGTRVVRLGMPASGSTSVGSSRLTLVGGAQAIADGEVLEISLNGTPTRFEFTSDALVTPGNIGVTFNTSETQDVIGARLAALISASTVDLQAIHLQDGNISLGGDARHLVSVNSAPSIGLFGRPGVQSSTTLNIVASTILQMPSRGGADLLDNSTFSLAGANRRVVFEFDGDFSGATASGNVVIQYVAANSAADIANLVAAAINAQNLGINAQLTGGGRVDLGVISPDQLVLNDSRITTLRGNVVDGDFFTISNRTTSVTFEFDNLSRANGFTPGRRAIQFTDLSTIDRVRDAMKAAIEDAGLGLTVELLPEGIRLNDSSLYTVDVTNAASLLKSGVPGGAFPIRFVQDSAFTGEMVAREIVAAINDRNGILHAKVRGGNTLFVEGAVSIDSDLASYFLRSIKDYDGNNLKPNRITNDTRFTILMPGQQLDYGDAPDPFTTTQGRYATQRANDGARHVATATGPRLGALRTSETEGKPTFDARGDVGDDGVVFVSTLNPQGIFNRNIATDITITTTGVGKVDAWIDFNADGDWDDPNEQILTSESFELGLLTRTFQVTIPSSVPAPTVATRSFARFRVSSEGGLQPSGLAVDGEVEDYEITIVPGTPPVAVNDSYRLDEDPIAAFATTDITGQATLGFVDDDGVAANDTDPEGRPFNVLLVSAPANAKQFTLNSDGTFVYRPADNFFGEDTFTYRVNDGVLTSNNIGTVTLNVRPVNDRPIAGNDPIFVLEDTPVELTAATLLSNDKAGPDNESGQTLRITNVQSPSNAGGTVSFVNGVVRYTPPTDFAGQDQFVYTIVDDGTTNGLADPLTQTVTVLITVRDQNDAPIIGADSFNVSEDGTLTRPISELTGNDTVGPANEQGIQTLRFVGVDQLTSGGGSVTISGNNFVYRPAADFVGVDTFVYTVEDNGLSENVADPKRSRGTVTVNVSAVNDIPRVLSPMGSATVAEDSTIQSIDLASVFFDPDVLNSGDVLTYSVTNNNTGLVTATIVNGRLQLQLRPDQVGQAIIRVEATDSQNQRIANSLTLNVTPVEDSPRLLLPIPDRSISEDSAEVVIPIAPQYLFDPDVASNGDVMTLSLVSNSNTGLVTAVIDGNNLRVTVAENGFGLATLTVRGTDRVGNSISDTFNIIVTPVNDPTTTRDDTYTVPQGSRLVTTDVTGSATTTVNDNGVLANDSDQEGDSFTAVLVDQPTRGTVVLNSNGTFTYTPTGTAGQQDFFTYKAVDGQGVESRVTRVSITIGNPLPPRHQNPVQPLDVNADGFISPIDALLIINFLNLSGGSVPVDNLNSPPPYRDVDGNNTISPLDALRVINHLNLNGSGEGEGEGEAPGLAASSFGGEVLVGSIGNIGESISIPTHRTIQSERFSTIQPRMGSTDPLLDSRMSLADYLEATSVFSDGLGISDVVESLARGQGDESGSDTDLALSDLLGWVEDDKDVM